MTTKKYKNATIKLLVGLLLLGASWRYLSGHPAERASLLSGVDVLSHRVQMRFGSIRGEDTAALEQKYKLKRYMQEMRYTAEHTSGCESGELIDVIDTTIDELNDLPAVQVSVQSTTYRNAIRNRELQIQDHCASSSDTE